ncbi:alpha-(1,6)-fucosyltransferase-like [Dreissena polymorpha]|uniref:alpha-(1,6)-fucosyltransferase-like n=1 Tax=Dreissena polymorpha TaxID=45954 RepID=UPI0022651102|nr:alpha-(1,6)-fucosyltransferase-like [Dreissena polymorpha]
MAGIRATVGDKSVTLLTIDHKDKMATFKFQRSTNQATAQELTSLKERLEIAQRQLVHSTTQPEVRGGPKFKYEVIRREMERVSEEKMKNDQSRLANAVDGDVDWRKREALRLTDLVQRRLDYLQNPSECDKAKKIICSPGKACGYGCRLHHVTYCLIMAYATQRTLILQSDFLPLAIPEDIADRLTRIHGDPSAWWVGQFVTYLTRLNAMMRKFLNETKEKLGFVNPIVGLHVRRTNKVGTEAQFHSIDKYMSYANEWFDIYQKQHPGVQKRVYLASDAPGVHHEAKQKGFPLQVIKHGCDAASVMVAVRHIPGCPSLDHLQIVSLVLLVWVPDHAAHIQVSDTGRYPNYTFVSDNEVSRTAGLGDCFTNASLHGLILDIYLISRYRFIVCTFIKYVDAKVKMAAEDIASVLKQL